MQCRSPLHDGATPGPSEKAKANSRFSSDTGVDCGEASIPPRGFTLIELATVVGILGLLLALVVPAAQSVREAARRSQCSAHMRQLGIAIHTYHDVYNVLPPGRIKSYDSRYFGPRPPCSSRIVDKSIFIFALQFIDNTNLYNCVNQDLAIIGAENSTIHVSATPIFTCPSDPTSGYPRDLVPSPLSEYGLPIRARMVFSSYAGMMGSLSVPAMPLPSNNCKVAGELVMQSNGVFNDLSPIRFSSIGDGLANTIIVTEKAASALEPIRAVNFVYPDHHGWYVTGNLGDTLATALYPPNAWKRLSPIAMAALSNSASSMHPSGFNGLMGDGSVRFIRDSIQSWPFDPMTGAPSGASTSAIGTWQGLPPGGVWQALATRSAAEGFDATGITQ